MTGEFEVNPWAYCKKVVVELISQITETDMQTVKKLIEIPPDPELGDIATTISFYLAKQQRKNPAEIANNIVERLKEKVKKTPLIDRVEAKGPYINFFLSPTEFAKFVIGAIFSLGDCYGKTTEYSGKRALIEFPAVNPSKPWHIGHARNAILGDTLCNVLEAVDFEVVRIDYINDLGLQIAQLTWKLLDEENPTEVKEKYDHYLGKVYVDVQEVFENNKTAEMKIRELARQLEDPTTEASKKSEVIVSECVKAQRQTAYKLGIYHDYLVWESSIAHSGLLEKAKELMLRCEYIFKMEHGEKKDCIVARLDALEEFKGMKDPYKVLFRSDGTRTYTGADVAFQMWKHGIIEDPFFYIPFEKQPNGKIVYRTSMAGEKHSIGKIDVVYNVIASAQAHPQKLIYNILKLLGYEKESENSHHVAYEFVGLEDVEFSGRKGTWIGYTVDDVLEKATTLARAEVERRNPDASKDFIEETAEKVAVGALRYFMLNASPERKITFRWEEALDFEGDAGPYLQYSYARAQRILEKYEREHNSPDFAFLTSPQEIALIKALSRFPEEVLEVVRDLHKQDKGTTFNSNRLTSFGYGLATLFSKFYENCPVLRAEKETREARIALVQAFKIVMGNCLRLLGIPVVDRM